MSYQRLPETVHTLYAELLDQLVQAEAETVARGLPPPGSLVSKQVKGNRYWYLQRTVAGHREQRYLGPESPSLLAWMERVREAGEERHGDERRRGELVDMLAAGGATTAPSAPGRVLKALAEAGLFRLGAVLVGTHAFNVLGNLLGVRFDDRHKRTEDVDVAYDPFVAVVVQSTEPPADAPAALTAADPGFLGVPGFDPRHPSTSFTVRGRDLRVDFLTPQRGRPSEAPVHLPRLGVAAQPLPFLDYLLESPVQAALLHDSGVLVNVPQPARFAFHKLWVASERPAAFHARAKKDRRQAEVLLEVLLEERPRDVRAAWEGVGEGRRGRIEEEVGKLELAVDF